jgi:hypothetical protein
MCPGNEALAAFLVQKREEYFVKSYSDGLDSVFIGAHKSVCESRVPLHNLREVSKVKCVSFKPLQVDFNLNTSGLIA